MSEPEPSAPTAFDAAAVRAVAPAPLFALHGRVALVTGAAGGIGRWLAAGLGAAGAAVVVSDVDGDALAGVEATLRAGGVDVTAAVVDLDDDDAPDRLVDAAMAAFGGLHVVVNNA